MLETLNNQYIKLSSLKMHELHKKRVQLFKLIRAKLDSMGFLEVETPILYSKPEISPIEQFKTLNPSNGKAYYLRVAPTEHLKRLMTADYKQIYEFARNFRPGNDSYKHCTEFTSLEISKIGVDYNYMMDLCEDIIKEGVKAIKGDDTVNVGTKSFKLDPPWKRITVQDALNAEFNLDILNINSVKELHRVTKIEKIKNFTFLSEAIDYLIESYILPKAESPLFLTEFPYHLGGPAKPSKGDSRTKERCEAYIGSLEIANMSSHLNDLQQLKKWHVDTLNEKEKLFSDNYAQIDNDLFDFLENGLPDSAIIGIGIDRLLMMATNVKDIKEIVLFPFI